MPSVSLVFLAQFAVPMESPGSVSVLTSINFDRTNLNVRHTDFIMWFSDTLEEWLLPILVLGHSDLPHGFNGAKLNFSNSFTIII